MPDTDYLHPGGGSISSHRSTKLRLLHDTNRPDSDLSLADTVHPVFTLSTADRNPFQGGSTLKGRSLPLIQGGTTLVSGTRSEIRSWAYPLRLNANSSDKGNLPNPVACPSRSSYVRLINSRDEPSRDPATSICTHVSKDIMGTAQSPIETVGNNLGRSSGWTLTWDHQSSRA